MTTSTMRHNLGIHLRLQNSFVELAHQAVDLGVSHFQFFLTSSTKHNAYLPLKAEEKAAFLKMRPRFSHIYIHSSYWINPATGRDESARISYRLLSKELTMGQQLEMSALVLHPGSANGYKALAHEQTISHGIENVARMLNKIMRAFPSVKILLENTAHGNCTVGSNLHDFIQIKQKLDFPERVGFCLDFAHAHAFGYPLDDATSFYDLIDNTMGLSQLNLIHLNDTTESLGTKKDVHALPGKGIIGEHLLRNLVINPRIAGVPLLIEPPLITQDETISLLKLISDWKNC